jgi:mRNA interferase MazF
MLNPGSVVKRQPGREEGDSKRRPCVVISNAGPCRGHTAATVIVVPLTSDTDGQERLPMPVLTPSTANGLRTPAPQCALG